MKLLLLCHGAKHDLTKCKSNIIPITVKSVRVFTLLDLKSNSEPDIIQDWKKILPNKLHEKFDVISTMCCDGDLFIDKKGGFVDQSFQNIIVSLKRGGFFIMDGLAVSNIKQLSKYWSTLGNDKFPFDSNYKFDKTDFEKLYKNPYLENDDAVNFLNNFIAYSVEQTYNKLTWIRDPSDFISKLCINVYDEIYIADVLKKFNSNHLRLFYKI
jgi:hypothetical protein